MKRVTRCRTANPASCSPAMPTRSTATGGYRRKPKRRSAATIARSATWPGATPTATSIWSDRKSNMIISGGENIYPSEVEALVGAHPLVKDVAVIGLPDEKWGERVHAVVVLHDGASLKESDLTEWSKDRLAGYKRPRSYAFIAESEMPRNATGKVLHRELRARFVH